MAPEGERQLRWESIGQWARVGSEQDDPKPGPHIEDNKGYGTIAKLTANNEKR
jgi:hypothetical protein